MSHGGVDKSSLNVSLLLPVFSIPFDRQQVFDNYAVTVMIGGEPYTLGLFDTAGTVAHTW